MSWSLINQIGIGSGLVVFSVLLSGAIFLGLELVLARFYAWLIQPPHRPKMVLVLLISVIAALGMITVSVWIWAFAYWGLGVFVTFETSLYFSLVSFTTLGFGDIILPPEWRILSGMTAANGFLVIGMMSAVVLETLRYVRKNQLSS